jgi:hypothetical protein
MIGYGPPGSTGQLPMPGDEDRERRAAEEYGRRRRTRRRILWIALTVVVVAVVAAILVAHAAHHGGPAAHHGTLTYHFEPRSGHVRVLLTDNRSGKHTTWVTIRNAKGKLVFWGFTQFRDGIGSQTGSTSAALPAGTYTYAMYDTTGIHYTINKKGYEPAKDRFATGTLTIP